MVTLRVKFIALYAYIKNLERSHINNLILYLKALEKARTNNSQKTVAINSGIMLADPITQQDALVSLQANTYPAPESYSRI